jgi:hypothetical protein
VKLKQTESTKVKSKVDYSGGHIEHHSGVSHLVYIVVKDVNTYSVSTISLDVKYIDELIEALQTIKKVDEIKFILDNL